MPIKTITMNSVRELMETPGPCLTLVCNANGGLRTALNTLRRNYPGNEELLNPVQEAVEALPGNGRAPKQVAVLGSPSTMIVCHVSESVKPIAQIADHFDLRTLLEIAGAQRSFYILALSQNRTRLLACTQDSSEEVALPAGTPASLAESMQTRKPDHVLKNMNSAGPSHGSMKGVMSGTSTDREDKDEYVLHFFQALDRAVNAVLKEKNDPLVIAGVEHELALYNRVNTYGRLVGPGVHGAPDGLEGGEMHRRALEILDSHFHDPAVELLQDFDKRTGTGHASTHIQEIIAAAHEGRISHLYFQNSAQYMGTFDPVRQRVKHGENGDHATDLIDTAAAETILHGGEARVVNGSKMPNGVPVCALFRYPATKSAES